VSAQLEASKPAPQVVNNPKAGWSCGCVSAVDCDGRTIWIADAHRGDGKLTTFLELEAAIRKNSIDAVCQRLTESRSR